MQSDIFQNSDEDLVSLSRQVEIRFTGLFSEYLRIKKLALIVPGSLKNDLIRWRRMVVRHATGDFRHFESEKIALRSVAQWTLDTNCEMKNKPRTVIEWKD